MDENKPQEATGPAEWLRGQTAGDNQRQGCTLSVCSMEQSGVGVEIRNLPNALSCAKVHFRHRGSAIREIHDLGVPHRSSRPGAVIKGCRRFGLGAPARGIIIFSCACDPPWR
ncbi:hypothetical protein K474DRAFT_1039001 [Panus rudis PR-1116 ss-1]|nr:hypothetical protein K474DRAFT_1039001 [Panus rudis PR-1116 ss-1]